MTTFGMTPRPTSVGWIYVLGVAVVSTLGFTTGSTPTILLAALLALPSSVVAFPAFYVVYGLLAMIPGANPSSSSGSSSCAPTGECQASTPGDAAWFTLATETVGILALTAAALLNAVAVRNLRIAARRPGLMTPKR